jgi:TonB family protein
MRDNDRDRHLSGHLGRGFILSFFAHASFVFPLIAMAILFGKREANDDLEMSFEEVSPAELPDNLPPIEPEPTPPEPRRPQKAVVQSERKLEPTPADKLEPTPPEAEQPRPLPRKEKLSHEKMVDLDMGQEAAPPPDAKFLAQKNNRTKEETRARDTTLERSESSTEQAPSSKSDRQDDRVGDQDQKIARDVTQKSKRGRSAPEVTPHLNPRQPETQSPAPSKSLLAMRDAAKRDHEVTPETADPSLPRDPDGLRPLLEDRPASVKDLPGKPGTNEKARLALSGKQYQYLFGNDADAAAELASKQRSRRTGKFSERMGKINAALENFIPEVRPGNQTALNTRAAPFAAFIARMHRNIHELWGFGFLEDLDRKEGWGPGGQTGAMSDRNLETDLEIVLNGDGTIDKITIIRASGVVQFDVAAIDAVYSAGPYPDPPAEIRSGNGKIYVHWPFHRDDRQCATSYVDYFILDNAPAGKDKGEVEQRNLAELPHRNSSPASVKRLERQIASDDPAHRAKRRELAEAAGGERLPEPDYEANRRVAQQVVHADDPAARVLADAWFAAFAKGDVKAMLAHAAFPFRSSSGVAAKSAGELRKLLESLIEETPAPRTARALQIYSHGGARGALGALPAGFDDESPSLFAVTQISGDTFVLVLARSGNSWRAVGLARH